MDLSADLLWQNSPDAGRTLPRSQRTIPQPPHHLPVFGAKHFQPSMADGSDLGFQHILISTTALVVKQSQTTGHWQSIAEADCNVTRS
jgi:hypothetical protein